MHFILFVNGEEFTEWVNNVGHQMPHAIWTMFSYLKSAWISLAHFSTKYANVNVLRNVMPAADLDVSDLEKVAVATIAID